MHNAKKGSENRAKNPESSKKKKKKRESKTILLRLLTYQLRNQPYVDDGDCMKGHKHQRKFNPLSVGMAYLIIELLIIILQQYLSCSIEATRYYIHLQLTSWITEVF